MNVALACMCVLQVTDGVFTRWAVAAGAVSEWNPLLKSWVTGWEFIAMKALGGIACAMLLWLVHRRFPKLAAVSAASVIVFYGMVVLWNVNAFFAL